MSASTLENITNIKNHLIQTNGGDHILRELCAEAIRKAVRDVLALVGASSIAELDVPLKTAIGSVVEHNALMLLGLPKLNAPLDTRVGPFNVDLKFTSQGTWMIPPSCQGQFCMLFQYDDRADTFGAGFLHTAPETLTKKCNRDKKLSVSAKGKKAIQWITERQPLGVF